MGRVAERLRRRTAEEPRLTETVPRLRLGMIDLDTSHPAAFVPLLRELGHDVVVVTDAGAVRAPGYAELFAREFGIPSVVRDPREMLGQVDAVLVHSVDWSRHVPVARAFVEAAVPVLLDKPVSGSQQDLAEIREWLDGGAVVTGGSSLRWAREVVGSPPAAPVRALVTGCSGHPLDYGVHAYALAVAVAGCGLVAVRHLGGDPERVELRWSDGRAGIVIVDGGDGAGQPFYATIVTADGVRHVVPRFDDLYRDFLTETARRLGGRVAPEGGRSFVTPELAAVAALASADDGGRWVDLDRVPVGTAYEPTGFVSRYRARRRGR
jgi:hypothetical protein